MRDFARSPTHRQFPERERINSLAASSDVRPRDEKESFKVLDGPCPGKELREDCRLTVLLRKPGVEAGASSRG
ncbi:hypothetical protein K0M31_002140 [Melipona bicolor]|uniref:Uncharacterized protein n=1 Tax=Melipona bicolor TaxID=60889 RepID=A0AA40KYX0_9HYME|nr:hypothetical protein K0M31_002140 [Melipona bicolor]